MLPGLCSQKSSQTEAAQQHRNLYKYYLEIMYYILRSNKVKKKNYTKEKNTWGKTGSWLASRIDGTRSTRVEEPMYSTWSCNWKKHVYGEISLKLIHSSSSLLAAKITESGSRVNTFLVISWSNTSSKVWSMVAFLISGCSESTKGPNWWIGQTLCHIHFQLLKKEPKISINARALTSISNCGCFLVANASNSFRGSNNKLSVVVNGPAAMICSNLYSKQIMEYEKADLSLNKLMEDR